MANKPEDKLQQITNTNGLALTGKPALVQNNLGIFYGFLEKSDTRSGTALLRDGFMLSPDRHITFSQYLDYLSNDISDRYWEMESEFSYALNASEEDEDVESADLMPPDEDDVIPNEILISQDTFDEHQRNLSITDYASEGIFLIQKRTSSYENSKQVQSSAPLLSITNVIAIVAISEDNISHPGLHIVKKEIEDNGLLNEVAMFYDAVTPMITFGLLNIDLTLFSLFQLLESKEADKSTAKEKELSEEINAIPKARTSEYIISLIPQQVRSYINPELIKNDKSLAKYISKYLETLTRMPKLVVNSTQRTNLYRKKAQSNEQAK